MCFEDYDQLSTREVRESYICTHESSQPLPGAPVFGKEAGRTPKGADPGGSVLPGRPASLLWESEQDLFS